MIDFSIYNLSDDISKELSELNISYVFQPIFDATGDIFAYEALMRPKNCDVMNLISSYMGAKKLHILEVATLFGVFQEYERRGLDCFVCINSFPSESLSAEEVVTFNAAFPYSKEKGIIELLEYPADGRDTWDYKCNVLKDNNVYWAVDDFGTGINNMSAVERYKPNIVKLDRGLIADVHKSESKQRECRKWLNTFHEREILALAEGVETEEEYKCLVELGFDLFQGFYLGRPE